MRAIASLRAHVDRAADEVSREVARMYEGLEQLAAMTVLALQEVEVSDAAIEAWRADALTIDDDDYLERAAVLEAAVAGRLDPAELIFYAHRRYATHEAALRRMYQLRHLGPRLKRLRDRIGGVEWVYYQDAAGWALSFPMHDPHGTIPADFDWLDYLTFKSVEPSVNPNREIRWTPPNIDYGGKGLMVAPSIPVYLDDGSFAGVWSIDVPVSRLLEGVRLELDLPGQDTFIVDREGLLVAHRRIATIIPDEKGAYAREPIASLGGAFAELDAGSLFEDSSGERELEGADGSQLVCAHRTIEALGWAVVVTCPAKALFETLRSSFQQAFERLGHGDLGYRIDLDLGGEGQQLIEAYNEMAETLQRTLDERQREQQALQRTQRLQAIGQLAGGIAHDFNNLLTAILGSASLLELDGADSELVDDIKIASERAAAMTTQLLAFSRDRVVQPQVLDLGVTCREYEGLLRRLLPEGIALQLVAPPSVPPVMADPTQLLQVVLNLVVNARDALGTRGTIRVELQAGDDRVQLSVIDDGAGIPQETVARVFEPFFTTKGTGTGLGLATVREIVEQLGGTVSLESEIGAGTRVSVRVPVVDAPADEVGADDPRRGLDGKRVLVLDDDALVRRTTVRALQKHGCDAHSYGIAREALAALREAPFDALVTDVVMPERGGREVAEEARAIVPGIAVLFISGYTDDALLLHGVRSDERLLRKPFAPRKLVEVLALAIADAAD